MKTYFCLLLVTRGLLHVAYTAAHGARRTGWSASHEVPLLWSVARSWPTAAVASAFTGAPCTRGERAAGRAAFFCDMPDPTRQRASSACGGGDASCPPTRSDPAAWRGTCGGGGGATIHHPWQRPYATKYPPHTVMVMPALSPTMDKGNLQSW